MKPIGGPVQVRRVPHPNPLLPPPQQRMILKMIYLFE
jgi:hypothetical protein